MDILNRVRCAARCAVDIATADTRSGSYIITYDDLNIILTEDEYRAYFDMLVELVSQDVRVSDIDPVDYKLDMTLYLKFCPNAEMEDDD